MMRMEMPVIRQNGFTLIETLLYIALFAIILTGVIMSAYPLITGSESLSAHVTAQGEAGFVLRKFSWAFSDVVSVTVSGGNTLTVTQPSGSLVFTEDTGAIELNGVPLTASRVAFSNFAVSKTIPASGPEYIEVEFDAGTEHYGPARYYAY